MGIEKIKIEAFDEDYSKSLGSIEAVIHPDKDLRSLQIKLAKVQAGKHSAPCYSFQMVGVKNLQLGKIIVDATNAGVNKLNPPIHTVEEYIKKIRSVVSDWNGEIHSTPYLKITWGAIVFKCICSSFTLKYTLFKPDGMPLKAELMLTLQ